MIHISNNMSYREKILLETLKEHGETIKRLTEQLRIKDKEIEAYKRKIAYLVNILKAYFDELKKIIPISEYDIFIVEQTRQDLEKYLQEKRILSREEMIKISHRVFLPLIYQYIHEIKPVITYKEFIEWLRTQHPNIFNAYAYETITRCLRYLREEELLKTPEKRRGEFIITEKALKKLLNIKNEGKL